MIERAYSAGVRLAEARLGFAKEAGFLSNAWNMARQQVIGQPGLAMKQLANGQLMRPGGLLRQSLVPSTWTGKLFTYGFPALGMAGALTAPPEFRGSAIGSAAGSIGGAMLGTPLGVVGSVLGQQIGGLAGRSIGGAFDQPVQPSDPRL